MLQPQSRRLGQIFGQPLQSRMGLQELNILNLLHSRADCFVDIGCLAVYLPVTELRICRRILMFSRSIRPLCAPITFRISTI